MAIALVRRRPRAVTPGLMLLGGAFAATLVVRGGGLDARTPLIAAGLVLAAELAFWSHELRLPIAQEPRLPGRRAGQIVLTGIAAALVA
ncbi:MAG: hypothetical protein ACR2MU_02630, partial [Gaiellaceae bacterium]